MSVYPTPAPIVPGVPIQVLPSPIPAMAVPTAAYPDVAHFGLPCAPMSGPGSVVGAMAPPSVNADNWQGLFADAPGIIISWKKEYGNSFYIALSNNPTVPVLRGERHVTEKTITAPNSTEPIFFTRLDGKNLGQFAVTPSGEKTVWTGRETVGETCSRFFRCNDPVEAKGLNRDSSEAWTVRCWPCLAPLCSICSCRCGNVHCPSCRASCACHFGLGCLVRTLCPCTMLCCTPDMHCRPACQCGRGCLFKMLCPCAALFCTPDCKCKAGGCHCHAPHVACPKCACHFHCPSCGASCCKCQSGCAVCGVIFGACIACGHCVDKCCCAGPCYNCLIPLQECQPIHTSRDKPFAQITRITAKSHIAPLGCEPVSPFECPQHCFPRVDFQISVQFPTNMPPEGRASLVEYTLLRTLRMDGLTAF